MLVVGLTGGIGSGKSAVGAVFASLGIPVLDADLIAREVVQPGSEGLAAVVTAFGESILGDDASLDRARMRERIFTEPAARKSLESILHPRIRTEIVRRLQGLSADYAVVIIPLLLETGQADLVDRVLVVDCPEALQIERATRRDAVDPRQVQAIVEAQCPRTERLSAADDIIDNRGDLNRLTRQVKKLHETYLALARAANA